MSMLMASSRILQSERRSMSVTSESSGVSFSTVPNKADQRYTDDDVQATVKRFVRDLRSRYRGTQVPADLMTFVSHWLCGQLQQERQQWNGKLNAALNQVEVERRQGLASHSLVQVCLEQLQMILQCCKLQGNDAQTQIHNEWTENPHNAIQLYSQTLMEVFSHLVEDHLQCLELLDSSASFPEHVHDLSIAFLLRARLVKEEKLRCELVSKSQQSLKDKQQSLSAMRQNHTLESLVRSLESDVGKLRLALKKEKEKLKALEESGDKKSSMKNRVNKLETDVQRLRKLCVQKQDYIDWLKNQFFQMTQVVAEDKKQLEIVKTQPGVTKHAKKTDGGAKKGKDKSQAKSGDTEAQGKNTTDTLLAREINLTRSPGSVKSAETANSAGTQHSIEISEDKLNVLKMKAKKLEDSLREAMNQMSEYAAKAARKSQNNVDATAEQRIADLPSQGVVLKVPKRINMSKTVLGKVSTKAEGKLQEFPRKSKLDKSFKELQNSFANKHNTVLFTAQNVSVQPSTVTSPRKNQVSKCFRCKKIFRMSDNHKLACCFHVKGKERIEKYGEDGKLTHVAFVWQCCGQNLDNPGCCTGHHV